MLRYPNLGTTPEIGHRSIGRYSHNLNSSLCIELYAEFMQQLSHETHVTDICVISFVAYILS
jgi:hypothetical protein